MRAINSIRARLTLLVVLPLVPLLAVFVHATFGLVHAREEAEITANLELGRMAARAFEDFVGDVHRTILPVGEALARGRLSREDALRLLEHTVAEYQSLREISWTSPAGTVLLSTNAKANGLEVGDREYFRRLASGEPTAVSDLLQARTDDGFIFVIGRGVRDGSRLLGMVLAVVDPERLAARRFSVTRVGDAALTLVDREGRIAFRSPSDALAWEQRGIAAYEPLVHRALSGGEATGVFTAERGGDRLGAAVPVRGVGWAALATRRVGEIHAPVRREIAESAIVALIAAGLAFAASRLVAGRIVRALGRLEAHAEALGRGEPAEPPASSAPEIERLASAYANMAGRVQSARDRLQVLHECGKVLSETLEVEEVARRLAHFAVPALADWCRVEEVAPDGSSRTLATARAAGRGEAGARPERELHLPTHRTPMWRALSEGRTVHVPQVTPEVLESIAAGPEEVDALRRAGLRSWLVTPLAASARVLGVITFATAESGRVLGEADVRLLEEMARRAAQAIVNARLFGELQRAVRSREEVLSVVSHDLRTPLGAITLGARVLAGFPGAGEAPERARTTARRMLASAQRMSRLIDDLLDLSSLREGRLAMRLGACAPADLLRGAVEELRGAALEKGLELSYGLPPDLPDVRCDGDRVLQVLENLASNAIKATGQGEVRFTAEPRDGEVVFSVADTGPGISEEEQALLFEPFRRGAEAAYRGTGLGLAISRALVEAHGGRIWIESRPGEGTTVRFTIPTAEALSPRDGIEPPAAQDEAAGHDGHGTPPSADERPGRAP